jgi:hypothetical protein
VSPQIEIARPEMVLPRGLAGNARRPLRKMPAKMSHGRGKPAY